MCMQMQNETISQQDTLKEFNLILLFTCSLNILDDFKTSKGGKKKINKFCNKIKFYKQYYTA